MVSISKLCVTIVLLAASQIALAAWTYGQEKDPMGRGPIKWAMNPSTNTVNLIAPYQGAQRGSLRVRIHPEYGRDIVLSVGRGQFNCRVSGCSVLVRFDEGEPMRYPVVEPADRSSNAVFIGNYDDFVRGLLSAKVLRIEAEFFRNGPEIFAFNVAGLKWEEPESAEARTRTS